MTLLDIGILIWLAVSLISGLKMGFIYKSGTCIGFLIGLVLASRWTPFLAQEWDAGPVFTAVIFLILLGLISKLFGLVAIAVNKLFKIVALLPFLKTFNRVFGGIISVFVTSFIISSGLFIADTFSDGGDVSDYIHQSDLAESTMKLSIFIQPLLSEKMEDFYQTFTESS